MMLKKTTDIISLILSVLVFISLFVNIYTYNEKFNSWAEKEDAFIGVVVTISVVLIIAAIMAIVMIPATKKIKKITAGKTVKKLTPDTIRKNSAKYIRWQILEIVIFLIISKDMVLRFGCKNLNMNFAEAEFLAGRYQIVKEHLLVLAIITLIHMTITYFTADSQIDQNRGLTMFCRYCGSELSENVRFCLKCGKQVELNIVSSSTENKYDDTHLSSEDQKKVNYIYRKALFTVLAILIVILIVVFIAVYIKTRSHIDMERFLNQ